MSEQENIDLQKLSQRELLIVTHRKVSEIADLVEKLAERQAKQEIRISLIEQKVMFWGALFGSIAGLITTIIAAIIKTS